MQPYDVVYYSHSEWDHSRPVHSRVSESIVVHLPIDHRLNELFRDGCIATRSIRRDVVPSLMLCSIAKPGNRLVHSMSSVRADSLRVFAALLPKNRTKGTRGEGRLCRVLLGEVDDVVHMDAGFEPEQTLSSEIDVIARTIQLLGNR